MGKELTPLESLRKLAEMAKQGSAVLEAKGYFHFEEQAQAKGHDVQPMRECFRDFMLDRVKAKLDAFKAEVGRMQEVLDVWGDGTPDMGGHVFLEYEIALGKPMAGVFVDAHSKRTLEQFREGRDEIDAGKLAMFKSGTLTTLEAWWALTCAADALEQLEEVEEVVDQHFFLKGHKPTAQA